MGYMQMMIIYFMFIIPILANHAQDFMQVMSWNSTEIEFRIPKNYPQNVVIFSFQVLQLPDYPTGSDVAQIVCSRPKRYSGMKRSKSKDKYEIKKPYKERRRDRKKDRDSSIINKRIGRNIRQEGRIVEDNPMKYRQKSQANIYRSTSRFMLVKNPNKLFKLQYDKRKSLLSLVFQRSLRENDYMLRINEHSVEVIIAMQDDCEKEKSKKIVKLYYVKLQITEPFQCKYPIERMCMLPTSDLYLRQWENRDPSPLLVLPSLHKLCPNLRRHIGINMTVHNAGSQAELSFYEMEDAVYNNVSLDRELTGSVLKFSLSCIIQDQQVYSTAHMTSPGVLFVEDENDSPPVASRNQNVLWKYPKFVKGIINRTDKLTDDIFVVDPDLIENNDFSLTIEGFDFKENTVQRSLTEFSVNKEYCYNETSKLKSPLKANCTIISPKLIFNEYLYDLNKGSINFRLVFKDNSLLNRKGKGEVSYNITILLDESNPSNIAKFEQNSHQEQINTHISISRPVQKYARLGKIGQLLTKSINFGVDITPSEGILYISNPSRLENILEQNGTLELTVKMGPKMVKKVFLTRSNETCPNKNSGTCAKHDHEDKCKESCGIGSSSTCQWRPLKGNFKTKTYATCSPGIATCPDGTCDEFEKLHAKICPQDCIVPKNMKNLDISKQTEPFSYSLGITHGLGVCTCDFSINDVQCQCFPVNENKYNRLNPRNPRRKTLPDGYSDSDQCGLGCKIVIIFFVFGGFIIVVMIFWKMKSCSTKYKEDHGGSNFQVDDHSSSFASGTIHGEAHAMARHAVRNNSPRQNNNQDLLSDTPLENYSIDKKWEFPRAQLIVEKTLGEGEFGRVMKARASDINGVPGSSIVAVKMLKSNSTVAELSDLLSEFDLLKEVSHPNVIKLLGACTTKGGPVYLIMEFCKYGSLRTYLRRSRHFELESRVGAASIEEPGIDYHVTPKDLLCFVWQICKGMSYLTTMKLVHRDLAARNILLAEEKQCKISDFGLTRDIYEGDLYLKRSKGRVPVKWMAPESLADHIYTHKSDVWSFGVLLWELVTLGSSPYPGVSPEHLFTLLKSGFRMEKPENCSIEMYQIMKNCWMEKHEMRPTFSQLTQTFGHMIETGIDYLELRSLIVTNRMYFNSSTNKSDFKENKNPHKLGSSLDELRSCDKLAQPAIDKDCYLLAKPLGPPTFPPTPLNPRIHAHNPSYSPAECNHSHILPDPLQYSMLLDVPDEEEDAKFEIADQQVSNQSEWDSDSGRATGDSGYITEDNKKALGCISVSNHPNCSMSLKPTKKCIQTNQYKNEEQIQQSPTDKEYILTTCSLSGIITPSPSTSVDSNRISSNSSIADGIISPDSQTPQNLLRETQLLYERKIVR